MADIELDSLIVRDFTKVSSEVFKQAVESGEIGENDLNFTKFMPASLWIFYSAWADHEVDDMSWLRADTFSWHSGDVYKAAYEHLAEDFENATTGYGWTGDTTGGIYITNGIPTVGDTVVGGGFTVGEVGSNYIAVYKNGVEYERATRNSAYDGTADTSQTETIGDITITYYQAKDGHKICLPDEGGSLAALYEATGVAWYYILDTTNKQFKLPRTKWGFTGLRDSVGGYVAPGAPNITGSVTSNLYSSTPTATGSFVQGSTSDTNIRNDGDGEPAGTLSFDASRSSSVYGASDTIQSPATQMYLYFYVGNFEQDAVEQTAGINAELFNKKIDLPANKTQADVDFVIASQLPTEANGYTWYRKYKSGWVEQGGAMTFPAAGTSMATKTITFPIAMADTNYTAQPTPIWAQPDAYYGWALQSKTTTSMTYNGYNTTQTTNLSWFVSGMSAQ